MKAAVLRSAGLCVLIFSVAACGDDKTNEDAALTKAAYIERADALCAEVRADVQAAAARRAGRVALQRIVLRRSLQLVRRIRQLRPPPQDADALDHWLGRIERTAPLARRLVRAAGAHSGRLKILEERAAAVTARSQRFAGRYGFEVCG